MQPTGAILLFDGVCNLCNGFVQFILLRDPDGYFQFASLQSRTGKALLAQYDLQPDALDTVVLIENNRAYTHSEVA
ncbi:MAG: DCC1-like thiol-disulfide oxidoreductase family protein, partial [Saprospiraceae bacterium]